MINVLNFIMQNYILLLFGAILILLAIIGSYADKTNFGQGNLKEKLERNNNKEMLGFNEDKLFIGDKSLVEDKPLVEDKSLVEDNVLTNFKTNEDSNQKETATEQNTLKSEDESTKKHKALKKSFEELDKEFDAVLPKKNIIDTSILDDIDNLSLDKTQKINLKSIPDLDDVDLPKIKKIDKEDKDIWKL